MNSHAQPGRRSTLALAGLIAVVSMIAVLMISGPNRGDAHSAYDHGTAAVAAKSDRQAAFHDSMRKLWEDHVTWTRLAIISFAHDLPDLPATQARLLRNQVHIGNAIKPFYGAGAGNRLTTLLKEHITGAVVLLGAAKSGDDAAVTRAKGDWYRNGNQIADFLSSANPRNWRRGAVRSLMRHHLDQTLREAVNRLSGQYAADVRDYDAIHRHILVMADTLSGGIIKQFPGRFR